MTIYEDADRGVFQEEAFAKQLISFEGMKFKGRSDLMNVTPTDIDGLIQLDKEKCVIFFELKHSGWTPIGQCKALTSLADAIQTGGMDCVVIVAIHSTPYNETVMAKDAKTDRVYWHGIWYQDTTNSTLYDCINRYIKQFRKE